jgi:hypothetical protein
MLGCTYLKVVDTELLRWINERRTIEDAIAHAV